MGAKTGIMHGRDHRPTGADPIPGVIVFDYQNIGGYLYVDTNGNAFDLLSSGGGMNIYSGAGGLSIGTEDASLSLYSGLGTISVGSGDEYVELDTDSFSVHTPGLQVEINGSNTAGMNLVSGGGVFARDFGVRSIQIGAGNSSDQGTVVIEAFDGQSPTIETYQYVGHVDFPPTSYAYDGTTIQILGNQTFTVVGSDGHPMFQVRDDGSIHGPSGGSVVWDL